MKLALPFLLLATTIPSVEGKVASLLLFNSELVRNLSMMERTPRVFLGAQLNPDTAAISWTKCVPESNVLITQLSVQAEELPEDIIRLAAAHEACHAVLHEKTLCSAEYQEMIPMLRKHLHNNMEIAAQKCATDLRGRAAK